MILNPNKIKLFARKACLIFSKIFSTSCFAAFLYAALLICLEFYPGLHPKFQANPESRSIVLGISSLTHGFSKAMARE